MRRGDHGSDVKVIQEWLCLNGFGVLIDRHYGAATEFAVRQFQAQHHLPQTGVVDGATREKLIEPFTRATARAGAHHSLSSAVLECAERYLKEQAREVGNNNHGPWVREFMGAKREGKAWCAGFATYCVNQAAVSLNRTAPLPRIFAVGALVREARRRGLLLVNPNHAQRLAIAPGSLFVVRKPHKGHTHVGIVQSVVNGEVFTTIEGNSSDLSETRSYEVCRRIRGFGAMTKDFIRLA